MDQSEPGPGTYNPLESSFGGATTYSISKAQRFASKSPHDLGPGQYNPADVHSIRSAALDKAKRVLPQHPSQSPGPGSFRAFSPGGPSYSLSPRSALPTKINLNTGPGRYELDRPTSKDNSFKFRKEQRDYYKLTYRFGPGPSSYNLPSSIGSTGPVIGSQSRMKSKAKQVPGPGAYNIGRQMNKKTCSMRGREQYQYEDPTPGPGEYDDFFRKKNKRTNTFDKTARWKRRKTEIQPGPGQYEQATVKKIWISFGKEVRKDVKFQQVPGPGSYQVFGRKVPHPTRMKQPRTAFSGSYRFQIPSDQEKYQFPGPGAYNTKESRGVTAKFGKDIRKGFWGSEVPGPGNYSVNSTFGKIPQYRSRPNKKLQYL